MGGGGVPQERFTSGGKSYLTLVHKFTQENINLYSLDPRLNHSRPSAKIGAWTPRLIQGFSLLLMI